MVHYHGRQNYWPEEHKADGVCLRYIDEKLDVHEEFIEFYSLELTTAERSRAGGNILHVVWLVFSQSEEQWHV